MRTGTKVALLMRRPFNPLRGFAGRPGYFYDFTDETKLFQVSSGATAVATDYDPIGYATDLSGNAHHAVQATSGKRPLYVGQPSSYGDDLLGGLDGTWTAGTGWSVAAGVATKTAGSASLLTKTLTLTAGSTYCLTFNETRTAGTVTAQLSGGTTVSGVARSESANCFEFLVAVTGNVQFDFSADATFAGTVSLPTLREVTAFADYGARGNGTTANLQTPVVDFTGSNKITVVIGVIQRSLTASMLAEMGTYASGIGGWSITMPESADGALAFRYYGTGSNYGGWGSPGTNVGGGDGATPTSPRRAMVVTCEIDLAATTVATALIPRLGGAVCSTGSAVGAAPGGGNFGNLATYILARSGSSIFSDAVVRRMFVIQGALTTAQRELVEAWCGAGTAWGIATGDSITANYQGSDYGLSWVRGAGGLSLAYPGDNISEQKTRWDALTATEKAGAKFVVVQVGALDLNTSPTLTTAAQNIATLQDYIDTIRADVSSGCRIHVAAITPCRAWLVSTNGETNGEIAYQKWLAFNEAIGGGGATPITGVNQRITSHVALLNDGSGNLAPAYESYAVDGVHPNAAGRMIIGDAWRAALVADGLLS